MKKVLVLGGGGFIGGHLAKKLKDEGNWVRVVDIKNHEHFSHDEICDEFIQGDLKDINLVSKIMWAPRQTSTDDKENSFAKKEIICSIIKRKTKEKFLTQTQKNYYDVLISSEVTICSGPAGVGKSYITMKAAIDLLVDPSTPYEKIIIVRPAVEAEEKLGSLPGNVEEKLDPYIFPSYYLLNKIIGKETREKLKELKLLKFLLWHL
jgi:phosphate starvation-inducible protein PhoH